MPAEWPRKQLRPRHVRATSLLGIARGPGIYSRLAIDPAWQSQLVQCHYETDRSMAACTSKTTKAFHFPNWKRKLDDRAQPTTTMLPTVHVPSISKREFCLYLMKLDDQGSTTAILLAVHVRSLSIVNCLQRAILFGDVMMSVNNRSSAKRPHSKSKQSAPSRSYLYLDRNIIVGVCCNISRESQFYQDATFQVSIVSSKQELFSRIAVLPRGHVPSLNSQLQAGVVCILNLIDAGGSCDVSRESQPAPSEIFVHICKSTTEMFSNLSVEFCDQPTTTMQPTVQSSEYSTLRYAGHHVIRTLSLLVGLVGSAKT
ncbi:hypothetical protein J6590_022661 [Homalodisca vitripennis]|nr:hypothetical protein J6590_022661 [Homalodisca vitripennis]